MHQGKVPRTIGVATYMSVRSNFEHKTANREPDSSLHRLQMQKKAPCL
jgi:hypothetical protein